MNTSWLDAIYLSTPRDPRVHDYMVFSHELYIFRSSPKDEWGLIFLIFAGCHGQRRVKCSQRSSLMWRASIQTVSGSPFSRNYCAEILEEKHLEAIGWISGYHCTESRKIICKTVPHHHCSASKERHQQYWNKLHLLNINFKKCKISYRFGSKFHFQTIKMLLLIYLSTHSFIHILGILTSYKLPIIYFL